MNFIESFSIFGEDYTPISCLVVDEIPSSNTPGEVGMLAINIGSEKKEIYKCVSASSNSYEWEELGGTSTEIIDTLPDQGEEDKDYILSQNGTYFYYKWIDNGWRLIAGSKVKIVARPEDRPAIGDEFTDYYVGTDKYLHYRWNGKEYILIGSDSYSKDQIDQKFSNLNEKIGESSSESTQGTIIGRLESLEDYKNNYSGDNNKLTLEYDEDTFMLSLKDDKGIIDEAKIKGAGGGSGDSTGALTEMYFIWKENSTKTIINGEPAIIKYEAYVRTIDEKTLVAGDIELSIYNGINASTPTATITIDSETRTRTLDLSEYLSSTNSSTTFKIMMTYKEVLSDGKILLRSKRRDCSFTTVSLSLVPQDQNFDKSVKTGGLVPFKYTLNGLNLPKQLCYRLGEPDSVPIKLDPVYSNYSGTLNLPISTHGAHYFEVWCEVLLEGSVEPISTKHLYYDIMYAVPEDDTPIIRGLIDPTANLEQYYEIPFYYSVYTPNQLTTDRVRISKNGRESIKENVGRAEQRDTFNAEEAGDMTIIITCLSDKEEILSQKELSFYIKESDANIESVTDNLLLDFNPDGRTNNDSDYQTFYDINGNPVEGGWEFSDNFDWANGGWKYDEDGYSFCVKAGTYVKINHCLFNDVNILTKGNNEQGNGKEFKIKFKVSNVAKVDTKWLDCIGEDSLGNNMGIAFHAHEGYFNSSTNNLTIPYSEEDAIELDLNIVPITKTSTGSIKTDNISDIPMIMPYEDGTPMRPSVIESPSADFKQVTPVPITIGGENCECDIYIYRIKSYSKFLKEDDIIKNFIADAKGAEKLKRYTRNQKYLDCLITNEDGTTSLSPDLLAENFPHLRIIKISAPRFTKDKKDKVPDTQIEMIYHNGTDLQNWTAKNCMHSGQGTSSNAYGYAGRNLDLIMDINKIAEEQGIDASQVAKPPKVWFKNQTEKDALVGNDIAIQLTPTSVPANYFNIKVNIASSEHTNNAMLARRYDAYLPYASLAEERYLDLDEEGNIQFDEKGDKLYLYDVKNTMEFYNCVVFIQETDEEITSHKEFADTKWHFYSLGNIGDSKNTDKTRVVDPDDENEFCNEILDWNLPLSNFPSNTKTNIKSIEVDDSEHPYPLLDVAQELIDNRKGEEVFEYINNEYVPYTGEFEPDKKTYYIDALKYDDYEGNFTYEFRYLKDEGKEKAKIVWKNFYNFVISDSKNWKEELQEWFIEKSALYYYIFTLRYAMIDNRAKNSFWHYAKTGTMRKVHHPVEEMSHVYYEKSSEGVENAQYFTALDANDNGYYIPFTENFSSNKQYYTQYAFEFWDYDNDTALGIDNTGEFRIEYGTEEIDGGSYFRAHDSTFFVKLSEKFSREIASLYHEVDTNCFNPQHLINAFDEQQEQFSEHLWKLDYETKYKRTYVKGYGKEWDNRINPSDLPQDEKHEAETDFLKNKMNGRKKYQRRQFERDQSTYMAGRFDDASSMGDMLDLRVSLADELVPDGAPAREVDYSVTARTKGWINIYSRDGLRYSRERYMPNETKFIEYPRNDPDVVPNIDFLYIHNASTISDIGDISRLYMKTINLNSGTKLKKVIIGNSDPDFDNSEFNGLTISSNHKLLEELNIQNISKITDLPVLRDLTNLKTLYAQGSGLTSAEFAKYGRIEVAKLPSTMKKITAENLYQLETLLCADRKPTIVNGEEKIENYSNLQNLIVDNCPKLPQSQIKKMLSEATSLKEYYITGVNWTGENKLESADLLNRLVALYNEENKDKTVLKGEVFIDGSVRESELDKYTKAWPELEISYNTFIPQYKITFNDYDGKLLYSYYANEGEFIIDPVKTNKIDTPYRSETAQYKYTFSGWKFDKNVVDVESIPAAGNYTFTAEYSSEVQRYTVSWINSRNGDTLLIKENVSYGTELIFDRDLPQPFYDNDSGKSYLFRGWDNSTGFIDKNLTVTTLWEEGMRTFDPSTAAEVHSAIESGDYIDEQIEARRWGAGKRFDIRLGEDFDFENAKSTVYVPLGETLICSDLAEDKQFSFLNENKSFTFVIDFKMVSGRDYGKIFEIVTEDGASIVYLYTQLVPGYGTSNIFLQIENQSPIKLCDIGGRNVLVLQFDIDTKKLSYYLYDTGVTTYLGRLIVNSKTQGNLVPVSITNTFKKSKIIFHRFTGENSCNIFWSKKWDANLGNANCEKLINWPREILSIGYIGKDFYDGSKASFIGLTTIGDRKGHSHTPIKGTNITTNWENSSLREFLQERVYTAFPIQWRLLIKNTSQQCLNPDLPENGTEPTLSAVSSTIYIPSRIELDHLSTTSPPVIQEVYLKESNYIPWHTNAHSTAKLSEGLVIPNEKISSQENIKVYYGTQDPLASADVEVNEFDRWAQYGFTFAIRKETLKRLGLAPSQPVIEEADLAWVQMGSIWTRSVNPNGQFPANPDATGQKPWFNNYVSGTLYGHYPISTYSRILPCFSI